MQYLLIFLACVAITVAIAEWRLDVAARERRVVSIQWVAENDRINRMNLGKLKSSAEKPVWRSSGIPAPVAKLPQKHRVLVVGDSFVWGDGYLNANDIWWRQLERELHKRGYWNLDVVAAGLNGASTQEQLRWLRDTSLVQDTAPDILILGYVTNDPDVADSSGHRFVKLIGEDVQPPAWHSLDVTLGRIAPNLTAQIKQRFTRKWETTISGAYPYNEWELRLLEPVNLDRYRRIVADLGEVVRSIGKPFFVATLPNVPDLEGFRPRYAPIRSVYEAAGLQFHDLLPDFVREHPPGGEVLQWGINPANAHPGRISTRFYARKVADLIEREHPELLGPRSGVPAEVEPEINDWMPPTLGVRQKGKGEWEFQYPTEGQLAPRLPIGVPHAILSFEEPVAVQEIRLAGTHLKHGKVYLSVVSPATGIEEARLVELPEMSGAQMKWSLDGVRGSDRINGIRIVAKLGEEKDRVTLDARTFRNSGLGGHGFFVDVPQLANESDDMQNPSRSQWALFEEQTALPYPHSLHAEISEKGAGRWSHWGSGVFFSTVDGSDPRSNGRKYEMVKTVSESLRLRLDIVFENAPIRP